MGRFGEHIPTLCVTSLGDICPTGNEMALRDLLASVGLSSELGDDLKAGDIEGGDHMCDRSPKTRDRHRVAVCLGSLHTFVSDLEIEKRVSAPSQDPVELGECERELLVR